VSVDANNCKVGHVWNGGGVHQNKDDANWEMNVDAAPTAAV